jgi:hypothetical protein
VLEREVRANLVYRDFTRVGGTKMPDAKTMGRWGVAVALTVTATVAAITTVSQSGSMRSRAAKGKTAPAGAGTYQQ